MATITGTAGNDIIHRIGDGIAVPAGWAELLGVTLLNDTLLGMAGNDILYGDAGNDFLNGGIGVDISYPIHRFLYWSRALNAVLGGTEHQLARLGDWLADNDNLGWKYDFAEDTL